MPQVAAAATTFLTGAFTAAGASAGLAAGLASVTLNLASSLLLSAASNALAAGGATRQQDLARELSRPTTAPAVRFVYGHTLATGTPAGTPVKNQFIYGCWILNSRESDLSNFKLFFDKREVTFTGDPFDYDGNGAVAADDPFLDHVRFWLSRGDNDSPPARFTTEAPYSTSREDLWRPTSGWRGLTTIWMKLNSGDPDDVSVRWPSAPPFVEVEADWSKVYDPRNPAHDISDSATWEYSDNLSLCVLDSLTQNPIRQYQEINLDIESFEYAADKSDEIQPLKDGGVEPRWACGGTQSFAQGELEDQILPIVASAGGSLVRHGGKLGIQLPEYREPSQTHTDFLGASLAASDLVPTSDLVNEVLTTYTSIERGYESTELLPYIVPGSETQDGGISAPRNLDLSFCTSPTQAMRVRKIFGGLSRRQKSLSVILPPRAIELVPSSTITLDLPRPFGDKFNGIWEVQSTAPALNMFGDTDSVGLMVPVTLVKHSESIYDWDPFIDEEDITFVGYDSTRSSVTEPTNVVTEVFYQNTGSTIETIVRVLFDAAETASVDHYDIEFSTDNTTFQSGGTVPKDSMINGKLFKDFSISQTQDYYYRVRTVSGLSKSGWLNSNVVNADLTITTPSVIGAIGGIIVSGNTPDNPSFSYVTVSTNTTSDFSTSTLVGADVPLQPNTPFSFTKATPVGTSFYWIIPYTTTDLSGTTSGPFEATTT